MIEFWIGALICLGACVVFGIFAAIVYVMAVLKSATKS